MADSLKAVFGQIHGGLEAYYARWYHDRPMGISSVRRDELRELHRVLYKCINHMAAEYRTFAPRYMPLSDRDMALLEIQDRRPFRATTYRPDYIVSEDGRLLLCEITSRFFAHGMFLSYFSEVVADRFMAGFPGKTRQSAFEEMLAYMLGIVGDKRDIYVLKSADRTSEIRLYAPFYSYFGKRVTVIEAKDVEADIRSWSRGFVISALNQGDLLSFSTDTVRAMVDAGMYNDLRTILLIHDKRFMNLWFQDGFTDACLTPEETTFLRRHAIPTWPWGTNETQWEAARRHREDFIIKHRRLGKSDRLYAGPLMSPEAWEALWRDGEVRHAVLQPFIRQRRWPCVWEGQAFEDYICGMMLCVDDRYFDSGLIRASSLPVTNIGDDRKICPIHTDDPELLRRMDAL